MKKNSFSLFGLLTLSLIVSLHASNSGDEAVHSSEKDYPLSTWESDYNPVDFASPRHNKSLGIYPSMDPTPSTVGFYDGNMVTYMNLLKEKYPNGLCLQRCTSHSDRSLVGTTVDCSSSLQLEHLRQDGLMQRSIVDMLPPIKMLMAQRNAREKSRNWYASVFSCGRAQSKVPTLAAELLRSKVSGVRIQKYLEFKKPDIGNPEHQSKCFNDVHDEFLKLSNEKATDDETVYRTKLDANYKALSNKVHTQEQVAILQGEINRYRLATAAVVGVTALAGAGLYVYSKKK